LGCSVTLASFRDPAGSVFSIESRVFRSVSESSFEVLQEFLNSHAGRTLVRSERLIGMREVSWREMAELAIPGKHFEQANEPARVIEHERVWFPSYPYEWPNQMLFAAGELTIELAEAALTECFGLKDATPYNVLFQGPRPIFVDVLSFEKRDPHDPTWLPYAQFLRMFVFPLLVSKHFTMTPDQVFLGRAGGLEPEEVYAYSSWSKRLRSPLLTEASIPTWLHKRANRKASKLYAPTRVSDPEQAKFILGAQLRRLRKALHKANAITTRQSIWSEYMKTLSYSDEQFRLKADAVDRWLANFRP
jgi:hypothetical protein